MSDKTYNTPDDVAQTSAHTLPSLSDQQIQALQLMADGHSADVVGHLMKITSRSVTFHLKKVRAKLGAQNTTQAVAIALRGGLIE